MKKLLLLIASCAAMLAVSCNNQGEDTGKASLSVEPQELNFQASGNPSQTVTVTAENVKWNISMSAESKAWISATKTDDKTITVAVSDNETTTVRNGSILIESDNEKVESKRINIVQAAGEEKTYTMTVAPDVMTFAAEGAEPQEATVTVSDPKLSWTVAAEESIEEWVHVSAAGDKITISVDDNPATEGRAGNVIITPGMENVRPKAIRVTQNAKVLPASLEVNPTEINFEAHPQMVTVMVTAEHVDWDVKISDTPGEIGNSVSWIKNPTIFKEVDKPYFVVSVETNGKREERTGYLIVTSNVENVPSVTVTITQAANEDMTNLTGDVEITDMETGVNNYVVFAPNQEKWFDKDFATWDIDLWAAGVIKRHDYIGWNHYSGEGTRLHIEFISSRIVHNWDEEYDLPEGDYEVKAPEKDAEDKLVLVPFTISPGGYTTGNMCVVVGSWYLEAIGGEKEDVYAGMAPLTGGKVNVARNGEDYILTFDLLDDAGNKITGKCVTKLDNMRVNYMESDPPLPEPEQPEQPEEPDPDKPTPFGR